MAKIKITQIKSSIGYPDRQKRTLRALKLNHINAWVVVENTPQIQGMINKVKHLVKVEAV